MYMIENNALFIIYATCGTVDNSKMDKLGFNKKNDSNGRSQYIYVVIAKDGKEAVNAVKTSINKMFKPKNISFTPHKIILTKKHEFNISDEIYKLYTAHNTNHKYDIVKLESLNIPVIYKDPSTGSWNTLIKPISKLHTFNDIETTCITVVNGKEKIEISDFDKIRIPYLFMIRPSTIKSFPHQIFKENCDTFFEIGDIPIHIGCLESEFLRVFIFDCSCSLDYLIGFYNFIINYYAENKISYENFAMIGKFGPYGDFIDLKKVMKNLTNNAMI